MCSTLEKTLISKLQTTFTSETGQFLYSNMLKSVYIKEGKKYNAILHPRIKILFDAIDVCQWAVWCLLSTVPTHRYLCVSELFGACFPQCLLTDICVSVSCLVPAFHSAYSPISVCQWAVWCHLSTVPTHRYLCVSELFGACFPQCLLTDICVSVSCLVPPFHSAYSPISVCQWAVWCLLSTVPTHRYLCVSELFGACFPQCLLTDICVSVSCLVPPFHSAYSPISVCQWAVWWHLSTVPTHRYLCVSELFGASFPQCLLTDICVSVSCLVPAFHSAYSPISVCQWAVWWHLSTVPTHRYLCVSELFGATFPQYLLTDICVSVSCLVPAFHSAYSPISVCQWAVWCLLSTVPTHRYLCVSELFGACFPQCLLTDICVSVSCLVPAFHSAYSPISVCQWAVWCLLSTVPTHRYLCVSELFGACFPQCLLTDICVSVSCLVPAFHSAYSPISVCQWAVWCLLSTVPTHRYLCVSELFGASFPQCLLTDICVSVSCLVPAFHSAYSPISVCQWAVWCLLSTVPTHRYLCVSELFGACFPQCLLTDICVSVSCLVPPFHSTYSPISVCQWAVWCLFSTVPTHRYLCVSELFGATFPQCLLTDICVSVSCLVPAFHSAYSPISVCQWAVWCLFSTVPTHRYLCVSELFGACFPQCLLTDICVSVSCLVPPFHSAYSPISVCQWAVWWHLSTVPTHRYLCVSELFGASFPQCLLTDICVSVSCLVTPFHSAYSPISVCQWAVWCHLSTVPTHRYLCVSELFGACFPQCLLTDICVSVSCLVPAFHSAYSPISVCQWAVWCLLSTVPTHRYLCVSELFGACFPQCLLTDICVSVSCLVPAFHSAYSPISVCQWAVWCLLSTVPTHRYLCVSELFGACFPQCLLTDICVSVSCLVPPFHSAYSPISVCQWAVWCLLSTVPTHRYLCVSELFGATFPQCLLTDICVSVSCLVTPFHSAYSPISVCQWAVWCLFSTVPTHRYMCVSELFGDTFPQCLLTDICVSVSCLVPPFHSTYSPISVCQWAVWCLLSTVPTHRYLCVSELFGACFPQCLLTDICVSVSCLVPAFHSAYSPISVCQWAVWCLLSTVPTHRYLCVSELFGACFPQCLLTDICVSVSCLVPAFHSAYSPISVCQWAVWCLLSTVPTHRYLCVSELFGASFPQCLLTDICVSVSCLVPAFHSAYSPISVCQWAVWCLLSTVPTHRYLCVSELFGPGFPQCLLTDICVSVSCLVPPFHSTYSPISVCQWAVWCLFSTVPTHRYLCVSELFGATFPQCLLTDICVSVSCLVPAFHSAYSPISVCQWAVWCLLSTVPTHRYLCVSELFGACFPQCLLTDICVSVSCLVPAFHSAYSPISVCQWAVWCLLSTVPTHRYLCVSELFGATFPQYLLTDICVSVSCLVPAFHQVMLAAGLDPKPDIRVRRRTLNWGTGWHWGLRRSWLDCWERGGGGLVGVGGGEWG